MNWSNCLECTPANCKCAPRVTTIELRERVKRLRRANRHTDAAKLERIINETPRHLTR